MKLNSGPFVRTLIGSLVLLLAFVAVTNEALAREIRIFPTTPGVGGCAATTACDLVRAAAGLSPTTGPDAGVIPQPGDTLVVAPGTYGLIPPTAAYGAGAGVPPADGSGPVIIPGAAAAAAGFPTTMRDLEIRSRSGAPVTIIQPAAASDQANIYILADNVTLGGANPDQGMTIQGSSAGFPNVDIGGWSLQWVLTGAGATAGLPLGLIPGGQADEDITVQHNFVQNAGTGAVGSGGVQGDAPGVPNGIVVGYPGPAFGAAAAACSTRSIENFRFKGNELRNNNEAGLLFTPCVQQMGGTTEDEGILIEGNVFDGNGVAGATPGAGTGAAAGGGAVFYQDGLAIDNVGQIQRLRVTDNLFVRNHDNGINLGASGQNAFCQGLPQTTSTPAAGAVAVAPAVNPACGGAAQGGNGVAAGAPGQLEELIFDGNVSWRNGTVVGVQANTVGAGIVIANNGQIEDMDIVNNRDDSDPKNLGFTGNGGPGLIFLGYGQAIAGVPFVSGNIPTNPRHPLTLYNTAAGTQAAVLTGAGALVTDLDNVNIINNAITENGAGDPNANGFFGQVEGLIDGLVFLNSADLDPVEISENDIRLNNGDGALVAPLGRIRENLVANNLFRNNGTHPACPASASPANGPGQTVVPLCDIDNNLAAAATPNIPDFVGNGYSAVLVNDVDGVTFSGNISRENLFHGFFVGTLTSDVDNLVIDSDNLAEKNGLGLPPALGVPAPAQTGDGFEIAAFGDITGVRVDSSQFLQNGASGMHIDATSGSTLPTYFPASAGGAPPAAVAAGTFGAGSYGAPGQFAPPVSLGDLDDVGVTNSRFSLNGASAPTGSGNGLFTLADKATGISVEGSEGDQNDDHGFFFNTVDDLRTVNVSGSNASGNDRNNDTVGAGFFFDSTEDMDDVQAENLTGSDNFHGVHFDVRGENGRNLSVTGSSFEDNRDTGIRVTAADDLATVDVVDNLSQCNAFQFVINVVDRGDDINVTGNRFIGCSGTGITLGASGVSIMENDIRDNDVGIDVNRADRNAIHQNNIARNKQFGVDASGLGPSEEIDAIENWWGEPSGPEHEDNDGGIGDEITDKVIWDPYLGEPVGDTLSNFEIMEFTVPGEANVDEEVTFTANVKNTGSEEGIGSVAFRVFNGQTLVNSSSRSITLDPAGSTAVNFGFTFTAGGTYTIEVGTGDDTQSKEITVSGPTGTTIEDVIDANDDFRIGDSEILTAIEFWVSGDEVPGTGSTISDAKILFLIELWVTNGDISTLPASAKAAPQSAKPGNWLKAVFDFFAPAASLSRDTSSVEVAPGGSFTVTTEIKANQTLQGLLLSEQLPAGWTISEVSTAGGYFKASESKWLWLSASGTTTVTYTVNVPADAAQGSYTLKGQLKSADGLSTATVTSVRVSQPEALNVSDVRYNGSQFVALGSGITGLDVQVYNLGGQQVFSGQSQSGALSFNGLSNAGQQLANGVYLYVVTVNGTNGQQVRTDVGKLVVLR